MIENDEQRSLTVEWIQKFHEHADSIAQQVTTGGDDQVWAENQIRSYRSMANTLEEEVIDYDERKTRDAGV